MQLLLAQLGGIRVMGSVAFVFLFLGGAEANMSGPIGPKSVNGGSLSKGGEGVCNNCLDSVSKQISANILPGLNFHLNLRLYPYCKEF